MEARRSCQGALILHTWCFSNEDMLYTVAKMRGPNKRLDDQLQIRRSEGTGGRNKREGKTGRKKRLAKTFCWREYVHIIIFSEMSIISIQLLLAVVHFGIMLEESNVSAQEPGFVWCIFQLNTHSSCVSVTDRLRIQGVLSRSLGFSTLSLTSIYNKQQISFDRRITLSARGFLLIPGDFKLFHLLWRHRVYGL